MELLRIATAMMCVIAAVYSAPAPGSYCTPPSTAALQKQLFANSQDIIHETFTLLPYFEEMVKQNRTYSENMKFPMGDDELNCPDKPSQDPNDSINKRSLCPTYTVLNYNPNRYPTTLIEKECACNDGCSGDRDRVCEKFKYNIMVLIRSDECDSNKEYIYERKWQEITIGCGCAEPRHTR